MNQNGLDVWEVGIFEVKVMVAAYAMKHVILEFSIEFYYIIITLRGLNFTFISLAKERRCLG